MADNPINKFLKRKIANRNAVSTGSEMLDRAFKIPIGDFMLIRSEPQAGATAICLEIAEQCTKLGHPVVYYNADNSAFDHRLGGIDPELFILLRQGASFTELLSLVSEIKKDNLSPVYILDRLDLLPEGSGRENIAESIKQTDPTATVVVADKKRRRTEPLWSFVVEVVDAKPHYVDRRSIGHRVMVRGPYGSILTYIGYTSGRISKAYEKAALEIERGEKTKTDVFEFEGTEVRGLWKFMETMALRGL